MNKNYEYMQNCRTRRKQDMVYVMGDKCQICGYRNTINALDLHHINPEEKDFTFNKAEAHNWEVVSNELKKCILVCANCHREIHAGLITQALISSFDENRCNEITERINRVKHHHDKYCKKCGAIITNKATYCESCGYENRRVVERPDRETLKELIRTKPFLQIGNLYGVSDNAIRKWCIANNLPDKKTVIKSYSDEDWSKI